MRDTFSSVKLSYVLHIMSLLWYVVQIVWICYYPYIGGQLADTNPPPGLTIKTDQSFRDIVYAVGDYACGRVNFCNSSIAKYPNEHCFDCKPCKCDKKCFYFGDCCPDLLFRDSSQQSTPGSRHVSCEKRYLRWRKYTKEPYLFMVTKCPDDFVADESVKTKCDKAVVSDFDQANPVSSVQTQLTYRNKFCAVCHGVALYQLWGLQVKCRNTDSLNSASDKYELWKLVLDNPTCTMENFPPIDVNMRNCFGDPIKRCNVSGRWKTKNEYIETLCGMYSHPVEYERSLYKNEFCAICNEKRLNRNEACLEFNVVEPLERTYSLNVLIDFNPKPKLLDQVEKLPEVEKKCNLTETFSPFSGQCEKLKCSPRRILSDGVCEMFYASTKGLGHSFSLAVKFSQKLIKSDWSILSDQYQKRLHQEFAMYQPFVFSLLELKSYRRVPEFTGDTGPPVLLFSEEMTGMKVHVRMVSASARTLAEMEDSIKAVQTISFSMEVGLKNVTLTSVPVVCSDGREGFLEGEPWSSVGIVGRPEDLGCSFDNCLADVIYEPVQNTLDCPYLEFNLTIANFTFDVENSSLVFNNQTVSLNSSSYVICGDNLKLCSTALQYIQQEIADFLSSRTIPEDDSDMALTIVSIVCIALSLLCLLITFIIYCILPQLRTLPGMNTMALIFHLFSAQLFFQIGIRMTYNDTLCRAMGVLIHYLWMSSFAWMAMCAYHMYAVFTQMATHRFFSRTDEKKKIVRSFVGCNGSAAVVVLACIVYHLGTTQGERIGYGGRICFLNEPVDIGMFFAAPLGVVLIFNTFCFIRTAMAIRSVPDMKNAKNKDNRNHMLVYVRLSVLLGFTWVFGFIAAAIQSEPLWYVFVILNGLQGVFIFIAYCMNGRTWDMVTKRIGRKVSVKYTAGARSRSSVPETASTAL